MKSRCAPKNLNLCPMNLTHNKNRRLPYLLDFPLSFPLTFRSPCHAPLFFIPTTSSQYIRVVPRKYKTHWGCESDSYRNKLFTTNVLSGFNSQRNVSQMSCHFRKDVTGTQICSIWLSQYLSALDENVFVPFNWLKSVVVVVFLNLSNNTPTCKFPELEVRPAVACINKKIWVLKIP